MNPENPQTVPSGHLKTVLIAEQDPDIRERVATELRSDGYQVIALEGGLELCDYLERAEFSHGNLPTPDLILSDAQLSGCGALDICRMVSPTRPFILLAPHDDPDSWEGAEDAGACYVLDKPLNLPELRAAVACYLEEP